MDPNLPLVDFEHAAEPVEDVPLEDLTPLQLIWSVVQELLLIFVPAALLAIAVNLFVAETTVVFGASMQPLLYHRQRLVVEKVSYRFQEPKRGDVIVVESPGSEANLIKRLVAMPGDTIAIEAGVVHLNGNPIREPYVHHVSAEDHLRQYQLRPDEYFVMGDNRVNSHDSRNFGPIEEREIVGRAWLRYWPLPDMKFFAP